MPGPFTFPCIHTPTRTHTLAHLHEGSDTCVSVRSKITVVFTLCFFFVFCAAHTRFSHINFVLNLISNFALAFNIRLPPYFPLSHCPSVRMQSTFFYSLLTLCFCYHPAATTTATAALEPLLQFRVVCFARVFVNFTMFYYCSCA